MRIKEYYTWQEVRQMLDRIEYAAKVNQTIYEVEQIRREIE